MEKTRFTSYFSDFFQHNVGTMFANINLLAFGQQNKIIRGEAYFALSSFDYL